MKYQILVSNIFVILLVCVAPAQGEVLIDENFEVSDLTGLAAKGWGIINSTPSKPTTSIVITPAHSGSGALRQEYIGPTCDSNHVCDDATNSAISKHHVALDEIYTRQWVKYSPIDPNQPSGFVDQYNASAKQVYFNDGGADPYISTVLGYFWYGNAASSPSFGVQRANFQVLCPSGNFGPTCTYEPNIETVNIPKNEWVCIESHQKLNTVGKADGPNGEIHIWVNGTLTTEYKNIEFRNTNDAKFRKVKLFRQGSINLNRYEDDFAVATERIYCATPSGQIPSPALPVKPKSPTGLKVSN